MLIFTYNYYSLEGCMNFKIRKTADQLADIYYPEGDKGPQLGGNADQESETSEEINEDMEFQDQENYTPGNDNLVINKNDNPGDKFLPIMAKLKELVILVKSSYARDLIRATITKLGRNLGD
jgi:hypothetical protein